MRKIFCRIKNKWLRIIVIAIISLIAIYATLKVIIAVVFIEDLPKIKNIVNIPTTIIAKTHNQHLHGSSITVLPNGNVMAVWFEGSGERKANDVKIMANVKNKNGWGRPFRLADTENLPDINPVIYNHGKDIWLFYHTIVAKRWQSAQLRMKKGLWKNNKIVWGKTKIIKVNLENPIFKNNFTTRLKNKLETFIESKKNLFDGKLLVIPLKGKKQFVIKVDNWFEKMAINYVYDQSAGMYLKYVMALSRGNHQLNKRWWYPDFKTKITREMGWQTRSHPIYSNNRLLVPLYSDNFNMSIIMYSDDKGNSWKFSDPIVAGGNIQPTLVKQDNNIITAFMRDNGGPPKRIIMAKSYDNGITWSLPVDTKFNNPASAIDVVGLASGNWVMVFNDTIKHRNTLVLSISKDKGRSWEKPKTLKRTVSESFGYPALAVGQNGRMHLTFSTKYANSGAIDYYSFDEKWLTQ